MRIIRTRLTVALLVFVGAAVAQASSSNVVLNGSFESGTTNWTLFGQGAGVQYALTNPAADGAWAMRAASRTNLSHHVTQNILTNLLAEGNGTFFGIEFAVQVPVPSSVRCTLQITDAGGSSTLILAEKIVSAETGRWVTVRGGRTIDWQGTLTLASLRFELGQLTERVYPPTLLDRIRIVRDTDRDGLTDDVDPAPADSDANANQLPDGWESLHGLPDTPATADTDGDGFSDFEEYWAATQPTNALSRPAQPVNTNATAEARAVLRYLALLPSQPTQRVVVGQVVTDTASDYASQVVALAAQAGRWPAMMGVVYDMINGPIQHGVLTPYATNYWHDGGLVHVQWNPDNPWNGAFSGNTNNIDFPALFTPGSPSHTNYLAMLDEVAVGLRQLGDAGLTVLFRPLNECNSAQNWFQRRARADYVALYRWTFDYLAKTQGLNHVLWVYDALNGPHQQVPVTYFYPGDDVVDVFGVNLYDDDWILPFDLDRLSRDCPKPLAVPEGGPLAILNGTFTNTVYIEAISNRFPRLSYFGIYNSFPAAGNTTTNRYSLVDNVGAAALFDHPWIVTREELAWRDGLGPFGAWQRGHFTTNANRAVVSGAAADPDGDGEANLAEYAYGTDPRAAGGSALVPAAAGFAFPRSATATDVTWRVQITSDLPAADWQEAATRAGGAAWLTAPGIGLSESGGLVRVVDAGTATSLFWRVRISQP
jgi:mannan endo-1,4-beta-mannosidase